jgi:hypothetical protein
MRTTPQTNGYPREPRRREAPGDLLYAPRLADAFRPLLPHGDPFHEPGQVGARGDAQGRLERSAWPPAVSRVLVVECQDHPGPFGEQVATVAGNLAQLGERRVDAERVAARMVPAIPARVIPSGSGLRRAMAMLWTLPRIEQVF